MKSQLKVIEAGFHKKALVGQDYGPYTIDCVSAIERGGVFNPKGNCKTFPNFRTQQIS